MSYLSSCILVIFTCGAVAISCYDKCSVVSVQVTRGIFEGALVVQNRAVPSGPVSVNWCEQRFCLRLALDDTAAPPFITLSIPSAPGIFTLDELDARLESRAERLHGRLVVSEAHEDECGGYERCRQLEAMLDLDGRLTDAEVRGTAHISFHESAIDCCRVQCTSGQPWRIAD